MIPRIKESAKSKIIFMEKTVVLIKPDGMQQKVIGKVISRLEEAGYKLVASKLVRLTDEILNIWYAHHQDKNFFPGLVAFMKETPVLAMVWEGKNVAAGVREMAGPTDPKKAPKGTLRGDYGTANPRNILHASDSPESAQKEISLIFTPSEILRY